VNAKEPKGTGKALVNVLGFFSFLLASIILFAVAVGTVGGIFMSTKRLFQVKRVKSDEDIAVAKQKNEIATTTSEGQDLWELDGD
jgi:hypothetical protein